MLQKKDVRPLKERLANPLQLLEHQGFIRYSKNTFWPILEKVLRILLGITIGVWTARYLGPGDFGLFSYVQSLVALLSVFALLGLEGILIKELVNSPPHRRDALLGSSCVLQICAAAASFGLTLLATYLLRDEENVKTLILIHATSFFFLSTQNVFCYFQSQVKMKYGVCSRIAALLITKAMQVFLIIYGWPLSYFIMALTLEFAINALFLLIFYTANYPSPFRWRFDQRLALSLLKNSWPLMLSGFVLNIYTKIDQVMLKGLLGNQSVGLYAAATKVSLSCCLIPSLISTSLFPAIVNAKSAGEKAYLFRMQQLYDFMLLLSIGIAVPIVMFSETIVGVLYGEAFGESAQILAVHIVCGLFLSATNVRYVQMINDNLQRYDLLLHIVGASCNILFNFVFIQLYGTIGAAYGTLFSYVFSLFATGLMIKPVRPSFLMILRSYANVLGFKFLKKTYYSLN